MWRTLFTTLPFAALMILLSIVPPLWARSVLDPSRCDTLPITTTTIISLATSLFLLLCGAFFLLHTSLPPRPTFLLFQSSSFDPVFSWFYYLVKTSYPRMPGTVRRPLLMSFFVMGFYAWFLLCCYLAYIVQGDKRERWLELPPVWMKPRSWRGTTADLENEELDRDVEKGSIQREFERGSEDAELSPESPSIV